MTQYARLDGPAEGDYTPVRLSLCGRQPLENSLDGWLWAASAARTGQLGTALRDLNLREQPDSEAALLGIVPPNSTFFIIGPQERDHIPVRFCQGLASLDTSEE